MKQHIKVNTFAPSLAKVIAVAFPMPDDAPVTSATFPSSLPDMIDRGVVNFWQSFSYQEETNLDK